MAMLVRGASLMTTVRSEDISTANGAAAPTNRNPPAAATRLLSASKPSWVVRSESNVRKELIPKPDPPCVVCRGSGRVDCHNCKGKGRENRIDSEMLPQGEWPKWCRDCGGSGLFCCGRCLGTGEYRYIMGFKFMKKKVEKEEEQQQQSLFCQVRRKQMQIWWCI